MTATAGGVGRAAVFDPRPLCCRDGERSLRPICAHTSPKRLVEGCGVSRETRPQSQSPTISYPTITDDPNCLSGGCERRVKAKTASRGYGGRHQALRRRFAALVEAGLASCWRCGYLIAPGEPWDLGHDDWNRSRYVGRSMLGAIAQLVVGQHMETVHV